VMFIRCLSLHLQMDRLKAWNDIPRIDINAHLGEDAGFESPAIIVHQLLMLLSKQMIKTSQGELTTVRINLVDA
jgi:hypothetical protein